MFTIIGIEFQREVSLKSTWWDIIWSEGTPIINCKFLQFVDCLLFRRFICDICNAALKRKDHLTRHKQSHNSERPFVCTVCMKAFKRKEQLTLHFVIHSGEKRHVCNECGKGKYHETTSAKREHLITYFDLDRFLSKGSLAQTYSISHRSTSQSWTESTKSVAKPTGRATNAKSRSERTSVADPTEQHILQLNSFTPVFFNIHFYILAILVMCKTYLYETIVFIR